MCGIIFYSPTMWVSKLCVQTIAWLIMLAIFNVHRDVNVVNVHRDVNVHTDVNVVNMHSCKCAY